MTGLCNFFILDDFTFAASAKGATPKTIPHGLMEGPVKGHMGLKSSRKSTIHYLSCIYSSHG